MKIEVRITYGVDKSMGFKLPTCINAYNATYAMLKHFVKWHQNSWIDQFKIYEKKLQPTTNENGYISTIPTFDKKEWKTSIHTF
jgi:hypothetical protein